jgi:hypothetical protein
LKNFFESLWIEANHHLVVNNDSRSRAAVVFLYQLPHGGVVVRDVANFKFDSSLREESLSNVARRSAWLAVHHYLF